MKPVMVFFSFCSVSFSATSKYTLYKLREELTQQNYKSALSRAATRSLIGAARREHFHTFAPQPFLVHKAALFQVHKAVVL